MKSQQINQTKTTPQEENVFWNPKISAGLSILFSAAFGSFLVAKNWKKLGKTNEAKQNIVFGWITLVLITLSLFFVILDNPVFLLTPLILLVIWFVVLGKKQMDYFDKKQIENQKKSFLIPVIVSIAIGGFICLTPIILYFVLAFILGVAK